MGVKRKTKSFELQSINPSILKPGALRQATREVEAFIKSRRLTVAKRRAYIRSGGVKCPHCESTEIEADRVDCDDAIGTANVKCLDCKAEWVDMWKLVGVEPVDVRVNLIEGECDEKQHSAL